MTNENPYSFLQASAQLREAYKAMRKLAIMRAQTEEFYAALDQIALRLGCNVVLELKEEVRAELAKLVREDDKIEHCNAYFKDFGGGDHQGYMSGLAIPVDSDGVCRNRRFVNCDFHAGCSIPYENCEFVNCSGRPNHQQNS